MDQNRFSDKFKEGVDKLKGGVSVNDIEQFTRRHITEVLSVIAIVVAAVSSGYDFFLGGPRSAVLFVALGSIIAIFWPMPVERGIKQFYSFTFKQEKTTQIIVGVVKIVVALFIPFAIFAMVGLLAGSSYHYFVRHAQVTGQSKPSGRPMQGGSEGEHD